MVLKNDASGLRPEIRRLFRIAGPMMLAQGGIVAMGLVDTWYIGRTSASEMAGVALGNALAMLALGLGMGVSMGIEPLVSQAHGAGEGRRTRAWRVQGLYATAFVSVPLALAVLLVALAPSLLAGEGFGPQTQAYLLGRSPGIVLAALYGAYRSYLTSVGRSKPALYAMLAANVANFALDGLLLFQLGMGALGVGIATSVSSGVLLLVVRAAVREPAHPSDRRPVGREIRRVLELGLPIGAQFTAEIGIFSAVSLLIAREGEIALAGHQIAINLSAFTFMAAVGIAIGATARVGHHVGAGSAAEARRIGLVAIGLGGAFMASGGLVFFSVPESLARFFAPEAPVVVKSAAALLRIAAAFSVADGVQAVAAGALRGMGDTRSAFLANLGGHGLVGLPVALGLGIGLGWGAEGYWWGLTAGLVVTAVALTLRFLVLSARPVVRAEAAPPGEVLFNIASSVRLQAEPPPPRRS